MTNYNTFLNLKLMIVHQVQHAMVFIGFMPNPKNFGRFILGSSIVLHFNTPESNKAPMPSIVKRVMNYNHGMVISA